MSPATFALLSPCRMPKYRFARRSRCLSCSMTPTTLPAVSYPPAGTAGASGVRGLGLTAAAVQDRLGVAVRLAGALEDEVARRGESDSRAEVRCPRGVGPGPRV